MPAVQYLSGESDVVTISLPRIVFRYWVQPQGQTILSSPAPKAFSELRRASRALSQRKGRGYDERSVFSLLCLGGLAKARVDTVFAAKTGLASEFKHYVIDELLKVCGHRSHAYLRFYSVTTAFPRLCPCKVRIDQDA